MFTINTNTVVAENTITINNHSFMVTDDVAEQIYNLCIGNTSSKTVSNTAKAKPVAKKSSKKSTDKYLVKKDHPVHWDLDDNGDVVFKFDSYVGKKVYKAAANQAIAFDKLLNYPPFDSQPIEKTIAWMNEKHPVITAEAANAVKLVWERD